MASFLCRASKYAVTSKYPFVPSPGSSIVPVKGFVGFRLGSGQIQGSPGANPKVEIICTGLSEDVPERTAHLTYHIIGTIAVGPCTFRAALHMSALFAVW